MISVKIIYIFKLFLKLQFLIEVQSITETQLYPSYGIQIEDIPEFSARLTVSKCIQSFRYVKYNNNIYLGVKSYESSYYYAEVNSKFDVNHSCIFTNPKIVNKKDMFFTSKDEAEGLMFVINGCFIIKGKDNSFTGLLFLMKQNWLVDFLQEGLKFLNLSKDHKYHAENVFSYQSASLTHCKNLTKCNDLKFLIKRKCSNNLNSLFPVYDEKKLFLFLIISSVIFMVVGAISYFFWYRSD